MLSCSVLLFGKMVAEDNLFSGLISGRTSHVEMFQKEFLPRILKASEKDPGTLQSVSTISSEIH